MIFSGALHSLHFSTKRHTTIITANSMSLTIVEIVDLTIEDIELVELTIMEEEKKTVAEMNDEEFEQWCAEIDALNGSPEVYYQQREQVEASLAHLQCSRPRINIDKLLAEIKALDELIAAKNMVEKMEMKMERAEESLHLMDEMVQESLRNREERASVCELKLHELEEEFDVLSQHQNQLVKQVTNARHLSQSERAMLELKILDIKQAMHNNFNEAKKLCLG